MKELVIVEDTIYFTNSGKYGVPGIQKSFVLPFEDIKIVGIKCSMVLDEAIPYYILIDRFNILYIINPIFFSVETRDKFYSRFSIIDNEIHYPDDWYDKGHSFIVYPKKYVSIRLFKKWNDDFINYTILLIKKLFLRVNPAVGILSDECYKIT